MVRKPYNPYFDESAEQSPVIDPNTVYQADPEINFDNVKDMPGTAPETHREQTDPKDGKSILEKLRQAKDDVDKTKADKPTSGQTGGHAVDPASCPNCAESERVRMLALADLDNARKRLAREKEEFIKYAGESVIADILPALDNLDLALAYAPQDKDCRNFVIGVDMTRKLLLEALAKHGLEQVGDLGETFDPARHEAVQMEAHPDYQSGQVCSLMNKGYRLKDRLIRPARVKVCKND